MDEIRNIIGESIQVKQSLFLDDELIATLRNIVLGMADCLKSGGRILFCGNGGSAADAQHIAAELSGRFYIDRPPLDAEALHVNSSYMTAVANDYGYDAVFARAVEGKGRKGDYLVGISTSGNSPNVIAAIQKASELGIHTVGFTGEGGGKLAGLCDHLIAVPSNDTPRIQECHILLGHILCKQLEDIIFVDGHSNA